MANNRRIHSSHDEPALRLSDLKIGSAATVVDLLAQGAERWRLMDLGILPGTRIEAVMASPLGEPIAYRIRGSMIALRRQQAEQIEIQIDTGSDKA